ncbi:MAG: hypothetical protein U1F35_12405 [Steroidobacteraceae bacterium]
MQPQVIVTANIELSCASRGRKRCAGEALGGSRGRRCESSALATIFIVQGAGLSLGQALGCGETIAQIPNGEIRLSGRQ